MTELYKSSLEVCDGGDGVGRGGVGDGGDAFVLGILGSHAL